MWVLCIFSSLVYTKKYYYAHTQSERERERGSQQKYTLFIWRECIQAVFQVCVHFSRISTLFIKIRFNIPTNCSMFSFRLFLLLLLSFFLPFHSIVAAIFMYFCIYFSQVECFHIIYYRKRIFIYISKYLTYELNSGLRECNVHRCSSLRFCSIV